MNEEEFINDFYKGSDYRKFAILQEIYRENQQLKENNQSMQAEMAMTWDKLDKKEKKLNAIREQIKKEYEDAKKDCVPARRFALDHISEILEGENEC